MSSLKDYVTIKGNKEGLVFVLNEHCDFADLLKELKYKLEQSHQKILSGPVVQVKVQLGDRIIDENQKAEILRLFGRRENLVVQKIESGITGKPDPDRSAVKVIKGMIRSGQTVEHDGNLMLLGDVNPGGALRATGSLFVMGALRGLAHAGMSGDEEAIIAASYLRPTQLRIAEVISRPPDEWSTQESFMEFAYLKNRVMQIEKMSQLHKIRPGLCEEEGE